MPNRILKESICTSENIDLLTPFQETFFYRLMVNCDDYGRMDARPKVLSSKLFPLRDIRINQITDALRALSSAELVVLYEENGHPFLQMVTWDRHQTIRAKKSKYPAPDSTCKQMNADEIICKQMNADESKCSRNPIQSNPIRNPNPNPNPTRAREKDTLTDDGFDSFWKEYPNRVAKQDAVKAWKKLKVDPELLEKIMTGLSRWKASDEWSRDGGRYIPHPASWLNGKRWEDEVKPKADVPRQAPAPIRVMPANNFEQRDYSGVDDDLMAQLARDMAEFKRTGDV